MHGVETLWFAAYLKDHTRSVPMSYDWWTTPPGTVTPTTKRYGRFARLCPGPSFIHYFLQRSGNTFHCILYFVIVTLSMFLSLIVSLIHLILREDSHCSRTSGWKQEITTGRRSCKNVAVITLCKRRKQFGPPPHQAITFCHPPGYIHLDFLQRTSCLPALGPPHKNLGE